MGASGIRLAASTDRELLARLWIDLIDHHRRLDPDYPATPGLRDALERELDRGLGSPDCRLWIAGGDPEVAGFLFAEVELAADRGGRASQAAQGWIHELYVAPAARRNGLGRALVAQAERFFAARGVDRASVRVEVANSSALTFWSHLDFGARAHILERRIKGGPD